MESRAAHMLSSSSSVRGGRRTRRIPPVSRPPTCLALAVALLALGFASLPAHAFVTTAMGETMEWSITGIADSGITLVDSNSTRIMYAADIWAGQSYEVRMRMNPTQSNEISHIFAIQIPAFNRMVEARIDDPAGNKGEQNFGLTEHYFPNQIYYMLELGYHGYCTVPVNCPVT